MPFVQLPSLLPLTKSGGVLVVLQGNLAALLLLCMMLHLPTVLGLLLFLLLLLLPLIVSNEFRCKTSPVCGNCPALKQRLRRG